LLSSISNQVQEGNLHHKYTSQKALHTNLAISKRKKQKGKNLAMYRLNI
jgi:hypothetical protein